MSLPDLVNHATDKERFHSVEQYIEFCARYLEYVETGLQARIVSRNESHYQFFQYREEGSFNITRPLNSRLMYDAEGFAHAAQQFKMTLEQLRESQRPSKDLRENLIRTIYTLQQSIGAALDKRSTVSMAGEWRIYWLSGQPLCRTHIGAGCGR